MIANSFYVAVSFVWAPRANTNVLKFTINASVYVPVILMSDTLRANQECLRQILWYSMLSNLVSLVNRLTLMLLRLRGNGLILMESKIRIFHRLRFHPLQLFFFHFYTLIIHMPVDHHIIIKLILLAAVYINVIHDNLFY